MIMVDIILHHEAGPCDYESVGLYLPHAISLDDMHDDYSGAVMSDDKGCNVLAVHGWMASLRQTRCLWISAPFCPALPH